MFYATNEASDAVGTFFCKVFVNQLSENCFPEALATIIIARSYIRLVLAKRCRIRLKEALDEWT